MSVHRDMDLRASIEIVTPIICGVQNHSEGSWCFIPNRCLYKMNQGPQGNLDGMHASRIWYCRENKPDQGRPSNTKHGALTIKLACHTRLRAFLPRPRGKSRQRALISSNLDVHVTCLFSLVPVTPASSAGRLTLLWPLLLRDQGTYYTLP